jgi:hypothetical protein
MPGLVEHDLKLNENMADFRSSNIKKSRERILKKKADLDTYEKRSPSRVKNPDNKTELNTERSPVKK